ncbi:TPA: polymer-forming cytoskeletal protein [Vibrio cholerae]|uniref:bactofilin family protein n=1 Tax=Vibrio cholerae TaxID=666 RepID=UPI000505EBEB|nr:polymer-forming cytoskeletal protein [Vibrio cholerae]KFZ35680.1 hypothetical protein KV36_01160 [Vibrio cholerae O1 biovar El Tor]ATD23198.1 hypothetical protein AN947_04645 [Vibrio cholerae]KHE19662.1 hypothetical protein NA64_04545 [Vibrio cholerae]KHE23016.1 hypothetical protein NA51_02545 [Vibrio cholerae]KJD17831.1 hypothetical protein UN67_01155 [Vibrio cholerae O1 biovar El Tor]
MQVDGLVEGKLHVDKTLVVSESGTIHGEVFAEHLIINGFFEGTAHAEKIQIFSKGCVNGTLCSDDLSIEPGGRFTGDINSLHQHQVVEFPETKVAIEN